MALILHRSSLLNLYEIVKPLEKSTLIKTLILVSPNTLESALPFGHPMPKKKNIYIYIWVLKVPFLHIYTKKNLQQSCMLRAKRFQCFRQIWVLSYVPYLPVYKSIPHFGAKKKKCFSYFWVRFFLKNLPFILKFSFRYANLP